jgi:hypothetical protein
MLFDVLLESDELLDVDISMRSGGVGGDMFAEESQLLMEATGVSGGGDHIIQTSPSLRTKSHASIT